MLATAICQTDNTDFCYSVSDMGNGVRTFMQWVTLIALIDGSNGLGLGLGLRGWNICEVHCELFLAVRTGDLLDGLMPGVAYLKDDTT